MPTRWTLTRVFRRRPGCYGSRAIWLLSGALSFLPVALLGDTVTFAQFVESSAGGNDFRFINSGRTAFESRDPLTGATSIPVTFTMFSLSGENLPKDISGPQAAHLSFYIGTTSPAELVGNYFDQGLYSPNSSGAPQYGSIVITRDSPDHEFQQTNLLTISFDAVADGLEGVRNGQTASLTADNGSIENGQQDYIHFTSAYLSFAGDARENLALSFSSLSPCFTIQAIVKYARGGCASSASSSVLDYLHSFTAAGTGTFAVDPGATLQSPAPEPSTILLLLVGLAAVCKGSEKTKLYLSRLSSPNTANS